MCNCSYIICKCKYILYIYVYTDAHIQQPCTEHLGNLVLAGQQKYPIVSSVN